MTFTGYDLTFSEGGIGDLNNDGFLDVQFGNKVYYNTPNTNNWIKIKMQGIQSNSNGIGARVEIYGAFGKQIRDVRSGHGFSHQSSMNVHFGIGAATEITKIIIRWPSGMVDQINNPVLNQSKLIVQGATLGVNEFKNSAFTISPNPTTESLKINLKTGNDIKLVQIYNLLGKLVLESDLKNETLNVSSLSNGTYILLLRDFDGKDYAQKFIKE